MIEYINDNNYKFDFSEQEVLDALENALKEELTCPYDVFVSVSVVDADTIQKINSEFRDLDSATDVLSFPMNEFDTAGEFSGELFETSKEIEPDTGELLLGDVVLCYEKIINQAEEYGHSIKREFAFLVTHSLLHLCGFDHIDDADRKLMEERQQSILSRVNILRSR